MSENNSRAYCATHKYFATKKWKTPEEADADLKSHLQAYPGDDADVEEKQTASEMSESLLKQKFLINSALELLSNSTVAEPEQVGACIVTLPTGEAKCYQLKQTDCQKLGGTYIGGPCQ